MAGAEQLPPIDERPAAERRRRYAWAIAALAGLLAIAVLVGGRWLAEGTDVAAPTATPSIVVGELEGELVTPSPTPEPASPTLDPTAVPTAVPTPLETPVPPAPTAVPATVAPATPAPSAPATPAPTSAVAVASDPAEAVGLFYAYAVDEKFDAAYSLWSARMKSSFPREENLDGRFDQTAAISFTQLRTAAIDGDRAIVQADFIEEYETGSSREFIGYWELVLVDGTWLLDFPHY